MTKEKIRGGASWFWREWLKPLLLVAIVLGSFRSAVADWNDVPSGSMKPTILEGDRIFVNKVAYDLKVPFTTWHLAQWGDPARGDIVVLWSPADGKRLVKRVVGIPGDTVELRDGKLLVNGKRAEYAPLTEEQIKSHDLEGLGADLFATETLLGRSHSVMEDVMSSAGPITVPQGRYFLMGDHRDSSYDSRYWGCAERERIVGRASAVVLSLDHDHNFRPRWRRFFSALR